MHVDVLVMSNGILTVECAVASSIRSVAGAPDEANTTTFIWRSFMKEIIIQKKSFPVPPLAVILKHFFCVFISRSSYVLYLCHHYRFELITTLFRGRQFRQCIECAIPAIDKLEKRLDKYILHFLCFHFQRIVTEEGLGVG